jgi:UDPglucose--hexose-1-phosphate uridylyltransferase
MVTPPHAPHPGHSEPRLLYDPLAGRTVFVAPGRAARPDDADLVAAADGDGPSAWCPFCAGNEHRTPPAVARAPHDTALPWHARIVPNRYPVAGHAPSSRDADRLASRPAHGVHDVVIESARHETQVTAIEAAAWRDVWDLCRRRLDTLATCEDLVWATVFKNSGPRAGSSLEHLHSQLVAIDFLPSVVDAELKAAAADRKGFARLLDEAQADGRVVAEAAGLVAVVPTAARQPYETWILPRRPARWFHAAEPADVAALADLTRWYVDRLASLVPGSDYNWWLHQAPFADGAALADADGWHWHLEILPRLGQFAGFELGTGCHITTLAPGDAAVRLRDGGQPVEL